MGVLESLRSRILLPSFCILVLGSSWLWMQIVHELGHISAAILTGGTVERIELHPLQISRTQVHPNPYPRMVVWCGPLLGSGLPVLIWWSIPTVFKLCRNTAQFFAGFCLVANGAYIGSGLVFAVGDAATMLQLGAPPTLLASFGACCCGGGLSLWHQLGSPADLMSPSDEVSLVHTITAAAWLIGTIATMQLISAW